jgi:hypothetical protein
MVFLLPVDHRNIDFKAGDKTTQWEMVFTQEGHNPN